jgi:major membrane immunogen (membrane-anchored lipoprotein)
MLVMALTLTACSDSQLRKASVAIRDFAVALDKVQDGYTEAYKAGFIATDDYVATQRVIIEIAQAGQIATKAIRDLHDKNGALAGIDVALNLTEKLVTTGTLHIKNPNSRATITLSILVLRSVLTTTKAFLL